MKKQLLLGVSLCFLTTVQAQSSHTVDFNGYVSTTSNDLTNNFTGGFALAQQTTNGITGGSVLPAPTLTSNKALYNLRCYVNPSDASPTSVSISFKYSASGAASGDGGPEVGFKVATDSVGSPAAGFVTANISAYPFGGSMFSVDGAIDHYTSAAFNLVDGHWYQLQLKIHAIDVDSISTSAYIYELGASGTSSPVLVSSFLNNTEYTHGITWRHSYFLATLNGGVSGGVVYMDNFNVSSYSYAAGIKPVEMQRNIFISNPVTNKLSITTVYQGEIQYTIYNTAGTIIKTGIFDGSANVDVSSLPPSLYLISFLAQGNSMVQKFIKE